MSHRFRDVTGNVNICPRLRTSSKQPYDPGNETDRLFSWRKILALLYVYCILDCSYFSVGLSRLVCFDGAVAILVCKASEASTIWGECLNYRGKAREAEWGFVKWGGAASPLLLPSVVQTLSPDRARFQSRESKNRGTVNSLPVFSLHAKRCTWP